MADVIPAHGAQPEPAAEPAPALVAGVAPPVVGFGFQFTIIDR